MTRPRACARRLVAVALAFIVLVPAAQASAAPATVTGDAASRMVVDDALVSPGGYTDRTALSGDGRTAAVVARQVMNQRFGDVRVLTRSGSGWSEQAVLDRGTVVQDLALSADGATLAVLRAARWDFGPVAVEIWARLGAAWQRTDTWEVDGTPNEYRGMAMSGDGNTVLVSAPRGVGRKVDPGVVGWHRDAQGWVRDAVAGAATIGESWAGRSVALAADGRTGVISADGAGRHAVLTRGPQGWTRQTYLGPARVNAVLDRLAVSGDGARIVVGGGSGDGPVTVWQRAEGGTEYAATAVFTPQHLGSYSLFGSAVAISADGASVLVGAPGRYSGEARPGGVFRYVWTAQGWRWGGLLNLGNAGNDDRLGSTVAVSADGVTALTSAPSRRNSGFEDTYSVGAVVVYQSR